MSDAKHEAAMLITRFGEHSDARLTAKEWTQLSSMIEIAIRQATSAGLENAKLRIVQLENELAANQRRSGYCGVKQ